MTDAKPLSKKERQLFVSAARLDGLTSYGPNILAYEATCQALEKEVAELKGDLLANISDCADCNIAYENMLFLARRWSAVWKRAAKNQRAWRHCVAEIATKQMMATVRAWAWSAAWKRAAKKGRARVTEMLARITELDLATELEVKELHFRAGKLDVVLKHPLFLCFTASVIDIFFESGAENYLSFRLGPDERGIFSVTIQREGGVIPAEKVANLQQDLLIANERIETLADAYLQARAARGLMGG